MRKSSFGAMGAGYLKFNDFERFIDTHLFIKSVELSNSGEIFLNPELLDIIRFAYEKNVVLTAMNGVNFNTVSEEMIEALVKYQFRYITFSIDGASQEIYTLYRVNGNFDRVIMNIRKLNQYKETYNSKFPQLLWQYILMEHNECDVIQAKKLAAELNMEIRFKLPWDAKYEPRDIEMLKKETGLHYFNRDSFLRDTKDAYNVDMCYQLWLEPQINWDGRLLGCCGVYTADFNVNVFQVGLKKALGAKNYLYAKKMLRGNAPPIETAHIPCVKCSNYKTMIANKRFLV
jgi:hypothetical protein